MTLPHYAWDVTMSNIQKFFQVLVEQGLFKKISVKYGNFSIGLLAEELFNAHTDAHYT